MLCLPYSIASLEQQLMHAMQWVQSLPQTGLPLSRCMLDKGHARTHMPHDMQASVTRNFFAWTNAG